MNRIFVTVLYIVLFPLLEVRAQRSIDKNWTTISIENTDIELSVPNKWTIGKSEISNTYWVAIPDFGVGSTALRSIVASQKMDYSDSTDEEYRNGYLSVSQLFSDVAIVEYNPRFNVDGINGIFVFLIGESKYDTGLYYEVSIEFWHRGRYYMLHSQFDNTTSITPENIETIKKIGSSIKFK